MDEVDTAALYAEGRTRVCRLVADLGEARSVAVVPACPGWTVKDVVAHLTGICADILSGNLAGVATDPWTAEQVESRRRLPMGDIVAEWSDTGPQVEAMADAFPPAAGAQLVADLTTHEHDIRAALGVPGARDSSGVGLALEFIVELGFFPSVEGRGLPPLRVRADGREWVPQGEGEPAATVTGQPFELLRAFTGRRSADQIRKLSWEGDPEPYLPAFVFGPFNTPASPVVE